LTIARAIPVHELLLPSDPLETHDDPRAKRNAFVLAIGQALGGANASIVIATAGLAGGYVLPADQAAFATIPVSLFILGTALCTLPAQKLMGRVGRRPVFLGAASFGILAGLVSMQARALRSLLDAVPGHVHGRDVRCGCAFLSVRRR
jgi:MFS family permease